MESEKPKSHRERAEARLAVLDGVVFNSSTAENAGAIASIALAHAMLAIHEDLRAIRAKVDLPTKGPGSVGFSSMGV